MKSFFSIVTKAGPVIIGFAIFNVVFHLFFSGNLEYHRDELLYFALGEHPAIGYATVPPMIGWLAWIIQNTLGYSLFAVKTLPALMSGVMVLLIAAIAREMGGSKYAEILSAIGFSVAGFSLRTFILYQPVHLDMFFWTLLIYLIIRYINSGEEKYLLYFGFAAGASLLNKYLIGVMFLGLLIIVPFTEFRTIFRKKMFWYGIIAGFIVFLPNLAWQIVHKFPVFHHLSELNRTQLTNVDRLSFLKEQVMNPGFASILTIAGILFLFINKRASKYRFLGIVMLFIVFFLMLLRGKSYYTQGIFPFLVAAGAVSYDLRLKKMAFRILLPAVMVLLTIPLLPIGIPVFKADGMVRYFRNLEVKYGLVIGRTFEDNSIHSLPQDYADMLGWEELTRITDSAYKMIDDKRAAFIYCENYGQAGAITVIGKKYSLPEPVCFSESFRYWIPAGFKPDITSLIYINDEMGEDVKQVFRKIKKIGSILNPDAREFGTGVWLCQDPADSFNKFWKIRLEELNGVKAGTLSLRSFRFKTGSGSYNADRGTIMVQENLKRNSSRNITLPVMRIHSAAVNPAEPVFYLAGGPGQSNMKFKPPDKILENHDFVMIGYRGMDGSVVLDCPEVSSAIKGDGNDLLDKQSLTGLNEAYKKCAQRLLGKGIDLDAYTMIDVIGDMETARTALEYDRINLLSQSYGTRIAQIYGYMHPDVIHRSVMIGVNPPGHFVWEPDTIDHQIQYYARLWKQNTKCAARSADLTQTMHNVINKMPHHWLFLPIDPGKVRVLTFALLYHRKTAAMVFDTYVAAEKGDPSGLALMTLAYNFMFPSMITWGDLAAKAISADFDPARDYSGEMDPPNSILGSPMSKLLWSLTDWPTSPIPQEYRKVQHSDIETLLLSGNIDFSTPAGNATSELLPQLPNGKQIILSEAGHTGDIWHIQRSATVNLISGFFDSGITDGSGIAYTPMDFDVSWGFPKIIKAAMFSVLLILIGLAWLTRLIIRRISRVRTMRKKNGH